MKNANKNFDGALLAKLFYYFMHGVCIMTLIMYENPFR